MKTVFFFTAIFIIAHTSAQSKKDSLFSGKMKVDSAVLAKSKVSVQKPPADTLKKSGDVVNEKAITDTEMKTGVGVTGIAMADSAAVKSNVAAPPLKYEDNNKVWKKFTDEYTKIINTEMLNTKKIKKGGYIVTLEYEIGTDGVVSTKNIICDPKSEALVNLINERMMANAPQLAPMIRDGVARKSSRRQVINFTKEKN